MLDFAELHDVADAHAVDERTCYDMPTVTTVTTPTATVPAHVLTPAQLRTVPAPDLRNGIPGARPLSDWGLRIDARPVTAQIDALTHDCRTADDKLRAEFVRLVDALQALRLQFDVLIEEQARTITALEAYIHDHSEAEE